MAVTKAELEKQAKIKALRLLNDMSRTEEQLRTKLLHARYSPDVAEAAVEYAKSFGYIDDRNYARVFIEGRKNRKSKKELCMQLAGKGVSREDMEAAVEECYRQEDAANAIKKIMEKRHYDPAAATNADRQKLAAYLVRKGFCYDEVKAALQLSQDICSPLVTME